MTDAITLKHAAAQQMLKASQDAFSVRAASLTPKKLDAELAEAVGIDLATRQAGCDKVAMHQGKVTRVINGTTRLKPHETKGERVRSILKGQRKPSGMPKMRGR